MGAAAAEHEERRPLISATPAVDQVDDRHGGWETGRGIPMMSRSETILLTIKSMVGIGIFAIPYGFRLAGIAWGCVVLAFVFAICYIGGLLLIACKEQLEQERKLEFDDRTVTMLRETSSGTFTTYSDICDGAFGPFGRVLTDLLVCVLQCGTVTAYMIFIFETMSSAFDGVPKWRLAAPCLVILIPLLMNRRPEWVALMAMLADVLACSSLALFVFLAVDVISHRNVQPSYSFIAGESSLWIFIGIALFSVEGACLVLPIQSSMRSPSQFKEIWTISIVSVLFLYIMFGVIGYLAFGPATADIVLLNLKDSVTKTALQLVYCGALLLSSAIQAFPAIEILVGRFATNRSPFSNGKQHMVASVLISFGAVSVALFAPNFANVISILGDTFGSTLAFGLPAAILISINRDALSKSALIGLSAVMVLSVMCTVIGIHSMMWWNTQ